MLNFIKLYQNISTYIYIYIYICIGVAVKSLSAFKYMFPIFNLAESLAGLTLKPSKCTLIPSSEPFSEEVVSYIQAWLARNIPS